MKNKHYLTRISQKAILLNEQGKILTIRRTKTAPSRPLYWDLPGGRLDFGEDTKAGIIREIKEETGLKVSGLLLLDTSSKINDRGEFWVKLYYIACAPRKNVVLSFEHDDLKWVTPNELLKLKISPAIKKFARTYISFAKK